METSSAFPTGTLTFLFTDIEGSTRLLKALRCRPSDALGLERKQPPVLIEPRRS
jgi:hypothetical protein